MTIAELRDSCKGLAGRIPRDILIIAVLVLVSSLSFGLGYLAGLEAGRTVSVSIEPDLSQRSSPTGASEGQVVASKSGSKYYLPQCSGASRISEANKVWFSSVSAAQKAGYTPAANCGGL